MYRKRRWLIAAAIFLILILTISGGIRYRASYVRTAEDRPMRTISASSGLKDGAQVTGSGEEQSDRIYILGSDGSITQ